MRDRNDIDTDLTRRFDMDELKREMARKQRMERVRASRMAEQNRVASNSEGSQMERQARPTTNRSNASQYANPRSGRKNTPVKGQKKKSTKFKKRMKAYIILLSILSFMFLCYVMNTLYQYEDSFTDNYMSQVVKDVTKKAKKGKISKLCDIKSVEINSLETSKKSYKDAIKQIFKNEKITYKLDEKTKNSANPVYYIYANDQKLMKVTLKEKKKQHRLGLFTYPVWQVDKYEMATDRGLEYFDIYVPSNYTVEVNGTKLGENYISTKTENEDYNKFAEYVKLPTMVNYELNNFIQVPDIVIKDENGQRVETMIKDNKIEIANSYIKVDNYEEAKKHIKGDVDILKLAENWSLFLTDDLKGGTHGFAVLKPYLIKGSNFYNMASAWATSVDITFVSNHTLKNPAFTNESVTDFTIYSDRAFSCSVYLEKNMKIANGKDKTDVMHDKLFFVCYDDTDDGADNPTWRLIDMKSIVNK